MANTEEKQKKDTLDYSEELLDGRLLQNLQDYFCAATNLYCVCLSHSQGVVTKAYGSREELNYIHGKIGMARHVVLLNRLLSAELEDVVEEAIDEPYLKMCGIGIKVGGKIAAIWIVIGVLKEDGIYGEDVPACVRTTNTQQYYQSIKFLEMQTKQYFAVKLDELLAQEAFLKSRESQKKMQDELRRNEVITAVVQKLESENEFAGIVTDILKDVCNYLDIGSGTLVRISKDEAVLDMISEHVSLERDSEIKKMQKIPVAQVPYLTGKPYMISSDTLLTKEFEDFFAEHGYRAMLSLPIEVNGTSAMYLVFSEKNKNRIWKTEDIRFLNEVKQIVQSILAKKIAQNSLASSYASLEAILENIDCGICVRDPSDGKILYTNQRFQKLFPDMPLERAVETIFQTKDMRGGHGRFLEYHSEEENRWFDIYHTKIHWVDERAVTLSTIYDVTEKKLYQQKIEKQANNDFLTGLYNRMRCEHDLAYYITQAKECGGRGALLYMDLDDFKHINDGLGHQYGDVLLKSISHSLQRVDGVENTCYRMGGDEFIIIVAHEQFHKLNQILEEIRAAFSKPWFLKGADYYCTMSLGVVTFPDDGDTVQDLIKKADIALYEAKKSGKNRIEFYDDNVETTTSFKRLDLEKNMRYATLNACDEFEVYYQPVIDISKDGDPCAGAEALVRWNSETLGFISPSEFIPLAEYLGLINPIGEFVLREACKRLKYWNDMGHPDYRVNVNLSVVQLLQNDMVDRIRNIILETGVNSQNLTLEVTESLAINDIGRMKKILGEIKQLGVLVALDDFGTGYSSLNHIRELPIDIIKIDRCFIIDIGKDDYSEVFVKMVSELAETIGVHMCVEGVEENDQLQKLRDMKVQYIQGFYFGQPMRVEDFEKRYM